MVTGFVACGIIRFGDAGADLKRAIEVDKVPSSHYNWLRCLRNNKVWKRWCGFEALLRLIRFLHLIGNWLRCLRNNKVGRRGCGFERATEVDKVSSSQ
jgi:hypothetical protein